MTGDDNGYQKTTEVNKILEAWEQKDMKVTDSVDQRKGIHTPTAMEA